MKKIKLLCLALTVVISLLMLASCDTLTDALAGIGIDIPPSTAEELVERIEKNSAKLESYEVDISGELGIKLAGAQVVTNFTGKTIAVNIGEDDLFYYTESGATASSSLDTEASETMVSGYGYYNGYAYIFERATNNDGIELKLCSPMTAAEYEDYMAELGDSITVGMHWLTDCENTSFERGTGDDWVLTLSGYGEQGIATFSDLLSLERVYDEGDIRDLEIEIVASSDYVYRSIAIEAIFEEQDDYTPELSFDMSYKNHNSAKVDASKLIKDEFNEVDDIRLLNKLDRAIKDLSDARGGKAVLTANTEISPRGFNGIYNMTETDEIEWGVGDKGYFFNIDALIDEDTNIKMEYVAGKLYTTANSQQVSQPMEEIAAKATLDAILFSGYSKCAVKGIKAEDDGTYTFELALSPYALGELIGSSGALMSYEASINVEFAGDSIVIMESRVIVNFNYYSVQMSRDGYISNSGSVLFSDVVFAD